MLTWPPDRQRLRALLPLAVVALLASCVAGPVGSGSATPDRPSSERPSASPTLNPNQQQELGRTPPPATPATGPSQLPTPTVGPAPSPYAPDLEALLPSALRGVPFLRYSFPSSAICEGCDFCGIVCPGELPGLAKALGVQVSRIDVAVSQPDFDDPKAPKVVIVAYRVRGAPTSGLIDARIGAQQREGFPPAGIELRVAGKAVTWAVYGAIPSSGTMEYLYAHDDVLYRVVDGVELQEGGAPPSDTALAIEALP